MAGSERSEGPVFLTSVQEINLSPFTCPHSALPRSKSFPVGEHAVLWGNTRSSQGTGGARMSRDLTHNLKTTDELRRTV